MYEYRKMTAEQRKDLLRQRHLAGYPLHAPPRFSEFHGCCFITAACFNHQHILRDTERCGNFEQRLLSGIREIPESTIVAWVVLPNHYHLLLDVDLNQLRQTLGRLHNWTATEWNRQDGVPGRRVWYRFRCDPIMDEDHFNKVANYIHKNPMKHQYVRKTIDWPWTSLHSWLQDLGEDALRELWWRYPIDDGFGKGWDD